MQYNRNVIVGRVLKFQVNFVLACLCGIGNNLIFRIEISKIASTLRSQKCINATAIQMQCNTI